MAGKVDALSNGGWQAHVQLRVHGKKMNVRGPRRRVEEKRKAEVDLAIIADAGEAADASNGKDVVYDAMLKAAKRLKTSSNAETLTALGEVDSLSNGEWQAHVQLRVNGKNMNVRGPRRGAEQKRKAEVDLAIIADAGEAADASNGKTMAIK